MHNNVLLKKVEHPTGFKPTTVIFFVINLPGINILQLAGVERHPAPLERTDAGTWTLENDARGGIHRFRRRLVERR